MRECGGREDVRQRHQLALLVEAGREELVPHVPGQPRAVAQPLSASTGVLKTGVRTKCAEYGTGSENASNRVVDRDILVGRDDAQRRARRNLERIGAATSGVSSAKRRTGPRPCRRLFRAGVRSPSEGVVISQEPETRLYQLRAAVEATERCFGREARKA